MDPAGFAIGVVGLFSIFSTCMQCFEYVQCGKGFGKDYESAILKLDVSRLRLARWAELVGLHDPSRARELQSNLTKWETEIAEDLLGAIIEAFESVEKESKRYERMLKRAASNDDHGVDNALAVMDSEDENLSMALKRMHLRTKKMINLRNATTSTVKKVKWALYDKKKFDELVLKIKGSTDDLIQNFPQTRPMQQTLARQQVDEIAQDTEERLMLQIASEDTDSLLGDAVEDAITKYDGQRIGNVVVTGNARAFFGNDVAWGVKTQASQYIASMTIDGHAHVHAGNVYRGRGQRQIEFGQDVQRVAQSSQGVVFR